MKLFKKRAKNELLVTRYIDADLSEHIEKMDSLFVAKHLKTAQQLSVLKFDQIPEKASIKDYIQGLVLDYQKLVDYCNNRLNGKLQEARQVSEIADMKATASDITRQINETEDALAIVKAKFDDKAKQHKATIKKWQWVLIVLYFLAGFELVANMGAYSLLGGGMLASASVAIISGIVVFYWAHITPNMVLRFGGNNWKKQAFIFTLMAIPIGIIFYFFSAMRIDYLLKINPDMKGVFSGNPLVPTMVNFFAYLIATYLVFEFRPTETVRNLYKKYTDDLKEIELLTAKRSDLIATGNLLEPELRKRLLDYKNILLLGQQTEQDIETRMFACFHEFKTELFIRTNGKCTSLFTNDITKDLAPLKLNYQDINHKIETL